MCFCCQGEEISTQTSIASSSNTAAADDGNDSSDEDVAAPDDDDDDSEVEIEQGNEDTRLEEPGAENGSYSEVF